MLVAPLLGSMSDQLNLTVEMTTSTAHRLSHYDGACSSVHGHNMGWDVTIEFAYSANHEDNMSVDFKEVSDLIDEVDHALLLNNDDPIAQERIANEENWTWIDGNQQNPVVGWTTFNTAKYGKVFIFDGDPTVEILTEWLLSRIMNKYDTAIRANATVSETDKYEISRKAWNGKYE